jgi:hypothetical protein
MCDASTLAVESANACDCADTKGRSSEDKLCTACPDNCKTCTSDSPYQGYDTCSACVTSGVNNISPASYAFCVAYCPTGYNPIGCVAPTTDAEKLLLSYSFNTPAVSFTNDSTNTYTNSSFTLTVTRVNPAGHPARKRGLYFDGASNGFIPVSGLLLSHTFAVHAWILVDVSGA